MRLCFLSGVLFLATSYGFGQGPPPKADPVTTVDRDQAVKIALAHMNIDKLTKEPSAAFNLRVSESKMTKKDLDGLEAPRLGHRTKHKDLAGLPETFDVYYVTVQIGLAGDSAVHVTKSGGRVVLVQFLPEG